MGANATEVEVTAVAVEIPSLADRVEMVDEWEEATIEANKLARRDREYYDNHQWTKDELAALKERHQPALVKNRIARKINFILGEETRRRINPVCRPRTPEHTDDARAATDALRYVADEQRFDQIRSRVFRSMLVEGLGGALVECEDDGAGGYEHKLTHVHFDRIAYDPHSRAEDFQDARWVAVILWMDLDDAIIAYPDSAEQLQAAVASAGSSTNSLTSHTEDRPRQWVSAKRDRVKLVEQFYRIGDDYYRCLFTKGADIEEPARTYLVDQRGRSQCPLVLASCYVDSDNRRYGIVRSMISPQDEINKRSSKALHLLNVHGVIAERDAIREPDKFLAELARPDSFAEVEPGTLVEGRVQVRDGSALAQGQLALLQESKADIDTIGPSANVADAASSNLSGRAFVAMQSAASQELAPVFDSLRSWSHRVFALDWIAVRTYWTDLKWLRVTDDKDLAGYRFVALNQPMTRAKRMQQLIAQQDQGPAPDPMQALAAVAGEDAARIMQDAQGMLQQAAMVAQAQGMPPPPPEAVLQAVLSHPLMSAPVVVNNVAQMAVDIVIDDAPDTAILAQEEFATLSELLPTVASARPDVAPKLVAMMVKASSLPDKRELIKILDEQPQDPQAQQQALEASEIAKASAIAKVKVDETQAMLNEARAQTEQGKVAKVPSEIEHNKASAMSEAVWAGTVIGQGRM